jgi:hypothetical protein
MASPPRRLLRAAAAEICDPESGSGVVHAHGPDRENSAAIVPVTTGVVFAFESGGDQLALHVPYDSIDELWIGDDGQGEVEPSFASRRTIARAQATTSGKTEVDDQPLNEVDYLFHLHCSHSSGRKLSGLIQPRLTVEPLEN